MQTEGPLCQQMLTAEQPRPTGRRAARGNGTKNMSKVRCFKRGEYGHYVATCPKKKAFPNGPPRTVTAAKVNAFCVVITNDSSKAVVSATAVVKEQPVRKEQLVSILANYKPPEGQKKSWTSICDETDSEDDDNELYPAYFEIVEVKIMGQDEPVNNNDDLEGLPDLTPCHLVDDPSNCKEEWMTDKDDSDDTMPDSIADNVRESPSCEEMSFTITCMLIPDADPPELEVLTLMSTTGPKPTMVLLDTS